jgi:transposase
VVEVNRPDRAARRRRGKSDPLDAEAAARAVQARAGAIPKTGDGQVEMIRSLRVARATAIKARTQAINALKALVVTAPDELCEQLRALSAVRLVRTAAGLEPGPVTTRRPRPGWAWGPWPAATRLSRPSWRCWTPSWTG